MEKKMMRIHFLPSFYYSLIYFDCCGLYAQKKAYKKLLLSIYFSSQPRSTLVIIFSQYFLRFYEEWKYVFYSERKSQSKSNHFLWRPRLSSPRSRFFPCAFFTQSEKKICCKNNNNNNKCRGDIIVLFLKKKKGGKVMLSDALVASSRYT